MRPGHQKQEYMTNEIWKGYWELVANLERMTISSPIKTTKRPDLILWNTDCNIGILLELTVPWGENIPNAEQRKEMRYEEIIEEYKKLR